LLRVKYRKSRRQPPRPAIFTRGILIDIPRLKGVPYLEPGTPIYVEDLEAWEMKAGISKRLPTRRRRGTGGSSCCLPRRCRFAAAPDRRSIP